MSEGELIMIGDIPYSSFRERIMGYILKTSSVKKQRTLSRRILMPQTNLVL